MLPFATSLLTSVFVTLFNYVTFRLTNTPYLLTQTEVSLIFLSYSFGIVSSSLAGNFADKFSRKSVMIAGYIAILVGIFMTASTWLWLIIIGIAFVTTGFFIVHSIASSSVGAHAKQNKGHGTSLYLLFYYMGSSIIGTVGGWFYQYGGWNAIVMLTTVCVIISLLIVAKTRTENA